MIFFANFLSDLIVGAILGTLLAWWVGKRLSDFERSQERRDERRTEIEKAVRYLELLENEIDALVSMLPEMINAFQKGERAIAIPSLRTAFWDILQPSGELPRLLDPHLLASLVSFYFHLANARRASDVTVDSYRVPSQIADTKVTAFSNLTLCELKKALDCGKELPDKINSEIQALRSCLETF